MINAKFFCRIKLTLAWLLSSSIFASTAVFASSDEQGPPVHFLTGSYTAGSSEGINLFTYTPHLKTFENKGTVAVSKNPSYFALNFSHTRLYAVDESANGAINQFIWHTPTQQFKYRQRVSNVGDGPCYIAFNPAETQVAIANYGSGDVNVFEIADRRGKLKKIANFQGKARGKKEETSHMHFYNWESTGQFAYSIDLGTDSVYLHKDDGFRFETEKTLSMLSGDGPRHLAFHPHKNRVYILNELSNTLVGADINMETGQLKAFQRINALPKNTEGKNYAAAIKFSKDGRYLYITMRGVNLVSVFKVDNEGYATVIQHISSFGDWPRDFALSEDEKYLVVANQKSNNLVLFKRNSDTGILSKTDIVAQLDSPTFVTPFTKP
ncbi:lactonase family protein [Catenovulum sp. SM1970]|uniref:lactonase family protein n=1 Tax=Marinifaba aquimaris TaxID=2741323 RepID=UPI0015726492|nr:lactonase family protein [Marinifaba aquimaris]NTS76597.1 lactonase family protein [Marinifaba aquimaris]